MKKLIFRFLFLGGILACIVWFSITPKWDPAVDGISLLVGFLATVDRFAPIPGIRGLWNYRVTREGTEFSHAGRCHIDQDGTRITINGHRYRTGIVNGDNQRQADVDWPWESIWGQISDDGVLRFDYGITIKDRGDAKEIKGICRVKRLSNVEMSGTYHMLPPIAQRGLNAEWGTISFRKLPGGSQMSRPTRGYDADGYEI